MAKYLRIMVFGVIISIVFGVFYFSRPFAPAIQNDFYSEIPMSVELDESTQQKISGMMKKNESDALSVMKDQRLIINEGDTGTLSNLASVRKSLISALYGIAEKKGLIDITDTLSDLGIDDEINPLTESEKLATIEDLLKARSGIFIYSIGESQKMKEIRPKRGSYKHNEFFYYNNWDFNTLGVIFEKETGLTIGQAFYEWIAKPTGMKRFHPGNVVYQYSDDTSIPMYRIYMCTEDLVRFGSLYANNGKWNDEQIIPKEWVHRSFSAHSVVENIEEFTGYGYLWWINENSSPKLYWAVGSGGQFILIDRDNKLAISMMNNTGTSPLGIKIYQTLGRKESSYQEVKEIYNEIIKKEN